MTDDMKSTSIYIVYKPLLYRNIHALVIANTAVFRT